ncbi:hypothetical protein GFY24_20525 [Nocardia sp. SYP-A9097]|uniref:hypothetical protein n=1 Tax=Nocardia sp. SYP-A9097 TaxID=2663237 RepID=UPI00129B13C4|nr:hypothetical protein [Nocardia sp. SYP-A9097]MRH89799.1 hypothetical protein [Nocardia sp. SYP-A9097]
MNDLGNGEPFEMLIHAGELDNLAGWAVENRFREVGGELFGIWTDNGSAAVQLVLGPGRADRREIAARYGMRYLGVWHSRGAWGTAVPADDDIDTTRRVFETALFSRFIIARVTLATTDSEDLPISPLRFSGTKYRTIVDIAAFLVERDHPNFRESHWVVLPDISPLAAAARTAGIADTPTRPLKNWRVTAADGVIMLPRNGIGCPDGE